MRDQNFMNCKCALVKVRDKQVLMQKRLAKDLSVYNTCFAKGIRFQLQ